MATKGMSKAARAADTEQSDREYIARRNSKAEQALNRRLAKIAKTYVPGFAAGKFDGKPFSHEQVLTIDALTLKIMLEDAYFKGQESGMSVSSAVLRAF